MAKKKSRNASMWTKTLIVTFCIVIIGFGYAISYLVKWQVIQSEELTTITINQSLSTTTLSSMRGTIYDSTGKVLAQSASVWTVALSPNSISSEEKREVIAEGLAEILGLTYEEVYETASKNTSFVYLERKIETEVKDQILEFMSEEGITSGIRLLEDYKRYYPYGSTASVVLGFTGTDNNGLYGIEYQYDDELTGTTGILVSAQDAVGSNTISDEYEQYVEAEDGYSLVLTIDETVQSIVEKYLDEGAEQYEVQNGATAIVMDVNTGAIIAMAKSDQYDPNDPFTIADEDVQAELDALPEEEYSSAYNYALEQQWRNPAISDTYVPGSVFKTITASSALDGGYITEYTTYECTGSYVAYEGTSAIGCWTSGAHGYQTVWEGICNSCNPFFMQVAESMGASNFFDYFEAFGFTEKTGIDLPGEANSYYHDADMGPVELATTSFGQGFTITPLQMITATAAVVNGGYLVQPYVVSTVLDSDGNIVETTDTSYKRQVISEDVSELMVEILVENVETGTAKNGYVEGYSIGGKTGTSEKITEYVQGESEKLEYIASFCGFAPADDPQYALLVYYDEPQTALHSGGGIAAPTFAKIMEEILPYLGVEQETSDSDNVKKIVVPSIIGLTVAEAKEDLEEAGINWEVYTSGASDDDKVVMQVPTAGTYVPVDGDVIIHTTTEVATSDMCEVPDFVGKSVDDCYYLANKAGLQLIISGAATDDNLVASSQNVDAGKIVNEGTVITITFIDTSGIE